MPWKLPDRLPWVMLAANQIPKLDLPVPSRPAPIDSDPGGDTAGVAVLLPGPDDGLGFDRVGPGDARPSSRHCSSSWSSTTTSPSEALTRSSFGAKRKLLARAVAQAVVNDEAVDDAVMRCSVGQGWALRAHRSIGSLLDGSVIVMSFGLADQGCG